MSEQTRPDHETVLDPRNYTDSKSYAKAFFTRLLDHKIKTGKLDRNQAKKIRQREIGISVPE